MMLAKSRFHDAGAIAMRHARERCRIHPGAVESSEFPHNRARDGCELTRGHLKFLAE